MNVYSLDNTPSFVCGHRPEQLDAAFAWAVGFVAHGKEHGAVDAPVRAHAVLELPVFEAVVCLAIPDYQNLCEIELLLQHRCPPCRGHHTPHPDRTSTWGRLSLRPQPRLVAGSQQT